MSSAVKIVKANLLFVILGYINETDFDLTISCLVNNHKHSNLQSNLTRKHIKFFQENLFFQRGTKRTIKTTDRTITQHSTTTHDTHLKTIHYTREFYVKDYTVCQMAKLKLRKLRSSCLFSRHLNLPFFSLHNA